MTDSCIMVIVRVKSHRTPTGGGTVCVPQMGSPPRSPNVNSTTHEDKRVEMTGQDSLLESDPKLLILTFDNLIYEYS